MIAHTAESAVWGPGAPSVERRFRSLFLLNEPFNLLLAIQNDDNAPAAIRLTEALTARGAVPNVVSAVELMMPTAWRASVAIGTAAPNHGRHRFWKCQPRGGPPRRKSGSPRWVCDTRSRQLSGADR